MNLDDPLQTFIVECRDLLADMESALLDFDQAAQSDELVNSIFRAAHTIKGSAGLFRLEHIVDFTHGVESVLDRVRAGTLRLSDDLLLLLLSCCDHIASLVDALAAGQLDPLPALQLQGAPLLAQLSVWLAGGETANRATTEVGSAAEARAGDATAPALRTTDDGEALNGGHGADRVQADHWHISVRFGPDVLKNGLDPLSFISYLATVGQVSWLETVLDALPAVAKMEPETCYLGFEIAFQSLADQAAIEHVFEFVMDDCSLRIMQPHSRIDAFAALLELRRECAGLGELLLRCGSLSAPELALVQGWQAGLPGLSASAETQRVAEQQDGPSSLPTEAAPMALLEPVAGRQRQASESRSIRVDADKLDQLINLVGELIIAGASVQQVAQTTGVPGLHERTSKLNSLVEELRDSALQLRMVRIGGTFNRFQRVVHDVSRELGKDIALCIEGEDTELDKTVVEKIGDPLLHLVRNAIDHGIESAAVRLARGKPAQGSLRLTACHDSGSIVITVQDDGGGIQRDLVLAKAVERGLVEAGAHLSDEEVFALIFEPGFSTAGAVTQLSGRGVGMDVVKRNITALRGTVSLGSQEGVGTTVTVRLPLTLAIIDGFLVSVGKSVYAIPLDMIEECVAYTAEPGHNYTNLRGQVLPFIRLREIFGIQGKPSKGENIVVLKYGGHKAGLVVDTLLGEFQTVIKPLGQLFSEIKCISGSTILGSGDVALILDVPTLVRQAMLASQRASISVANLI
jgi:two-component system chemotaxis sensor kinase CheA